MGKVQNYVQFCAEHGLTTEYDVLSHIHAGLRSAPTTKTYSRWNDAELARLQREASASLAAYEAAVARGDVIRPPKPTIEEKAAGHPDLESTKAAKRLLEKRLAAAAMGEAPGSSRRGNPHPKRDYCRVLKAMTLDPESHD